VGTLVWRWKSDGFGEALPEQDPDGNGTQVSVHLRFPGQHYEPESGLHQNWMREYMPGYGRYAQADPIGQEGGLNLFSYVESHPTARVDPRGEYGPAGAAGSAAFNFGLQLTVNLLLTDFDLKRSLRCVDFGDVLISGAIGLIGPSFVPNVVKGAPGPGQLTQAWHQRALYASVSFPVGSSTKYASPPLRVGDECECKGLKLTNMLSAFSH